MSMSIDNISKLLNRCIEIIDQEDSIALSQEINALHAADAAELIEVMSAYYREEVLRLLGANFNPDILTYLDESVRESLIDSWAQAELSAALSKVDEQDAVEILSELTQESRRSLLRTLKPELRIILEEGLSYPDDSAGRMMQHEFIALPASLLVGQAITFLTKTKNIDSNSIFLVDEFRRPIGYVPFSALLAAPVDQVLLNISHSIIAKVTITQSQEDVCLAFKKYFIDTIPVIDNREKLVGVILLCNIIDIIYESAQESFLQTAGVTESDFYSTIISTLTARLKWLAVSSIHACIAAYVMFRFQDILGKNLILTSLNQILVAICGTAGLQAVTVTIKALIGRELIHANTNRAIRKEAIIGLLNGAIAALVLSLIVSIILISYVKVFYISLVFGVSIFLGIIFATVAGSVIPILLTRLGIDPAISAGPLLSSSADTMGILIILTLASYFL